MAPSVESLPEWLSDYCARVREALGIGHWDIKYEVLREVNGGADHGSCGTNPPYLMATIHFEQEHVAEDTQHARETVIHEHLHILIAPLCHATTQAVNCFIPKAQQRRDALRLFTDAEETTIVLLSRRVRWMLEGMSDGQRASAE